MRKKKLQCIVSFKTTTQAMAFEDRAKEEGLAGRIIPLPRVISAGCGLSWKDLPENKDLIMKLIDKYFLEYDEIHELTI